MRILETEFEYSGHSFKQTWRQGDLAVYECGLKGVGPHELELVIIKVAAEGKMPSGAIVPEREAYPSTSKWGTLGWSFPVRYKEWVLSLAEKLSGISKKSEFVRQMTHEFWGGQADQIKALDRYLK